MTPGYWMHETSGLLAPVIGLYLAGRDLVPPELEMMKTYLRQWMAAPWSGPDVAVLRADIEAIETTDELRSWFRRALEAGVDPL